MPLGRPIEVSGTRISVALFYALKKYILREGIVAICAGGGEAVTLGVDRGG